MNATIVERVAPWPGLHEVCPAWCDTIHNAAAHPEDRNHWSESVDVPVQAYRPELIDGVLTLGWLTVVVRQHMDAKHSSVELLDENRDTIYQIRLTAAEAEQLGTALLEMARLATA